MKMAVGAIRESPLREIGRGLFSEESLMSVATGTTKHEKDDGLSVASRLIAGSGDWIPASAGMTDGGVTQVIFRGIAHVGCHRHHET